MNMTLEGITVGAYDTKNGRTAPNLLGYNFVYVDRLTSAFAHNHYAEIVWPRWFSFYVWCRVWLSLLSSPKFIVNVYVPYVLFLVALMYTAYRFLGGVFFLAMGWLMDWHAVAIVSV